MKILEFIKSIPSLFTKDDAAEPLNRVKDRLNDSAKRIISAAAAFFSGYTFKSPESVKINTRILSAVKPFGVYSKARDVATVCDMAIPLLAKRITVLEKIHQAAFSATNAGSNITFFKANFLLYCQMLNVWLSYATRLISRLYDLETEAHGVRGADTRLTPAELEWMSKNEAVFIDVLRSLVESDAVFSSRINKAPDTVINEENLNLLNSVDSSNILPVEGTLMASAGFTPMLAIGKAWVAWQIKKRDDDIEEAEMLEVKLERLRRKLEDNPSEEELKILNETIEKRQSRLTKLRKSIADFEERYSAED